jgi:gliding motility-associated-like protein
MFSSSVSVPALFNTSPCGNIADPTQSCLLKKTFVKTYTLQPNTSGYVVTYQRCCRNAAIADIQDPGDHGATYFCTIPAAPLYNNSAVFKNYPEQVLCLGLPLLYDNSATDADGDSLSYGFVSALDGASDANIKPIPLPPPYTPVSYVSPYSAQVPLTGSPAIAIDPVTGMITGSPDKIGRYLVTVCCYEWRAGVLIDSVTREFQYIVINCDSKVVYQPYAGPDQVIMVGDSVQFNAIGGTSYSWTPSTYLSDPNIGDPVGHFPVAGRFTYTLHETSDSGCSGNANVTITVLNHSEFILPNAFTPNNDGLNDLLVPIPLFNCTLINFMVFNRWGNLVHDGGPSDIGWDGTFKGKKQDMGVYSYVILYVDNHGSWQKTKGNVTLIR